MQQSMKEKLHTYEALMNEGSYEEATLYLEELTSIFQKERFRPICSDTLLNAILTSKRQKAAQYNIQTSFQLLIPENLNIESSDLSSIFFNLMEMQLNPARLLIQINHLLTLLPDRRQTFLRYT